MSMGISIQYTVESQQKILTESCRSLSALPSTDRELLTFFVLL